MPQIVKAHADYPGSLAHRVETCLDARDARESLTLFSHPDAEARFGASVFWIRQGMLQEAQMQEFLEAWQTRRDGTRRGLLEVRP